MEANKETSTDKEVESQELESDITLDDIEDSDEDNDKFDIGIFNQSKLFKSRAVIVSLGVVGIVGLVVLSAYLLVNVGSKRANKKDIKSEEQTTRVVKIKTAGEAVDADSLWRNKQEENLETQGKSLSAQIDSIKDLMAQSAKEQQSKHEQEIMSLQEKLKFLEEELKENKNAANDFKIGGGSNAMAIAAPVKINRFKLTLSNPLNSDNYEPLKTADNYIPAGTVAKGVLLHGADVSTSLRAAQDPDPLTIEITDLGNLPNRFRSDLKNCRIRASVYGDLSNERGKVRIEKLSCTEKKTGVSIETEVAGYLTDESGKVGVKGRVVSKDYKLIQNSLVGGVLAGLADTGAQSAEYTNSFTIGLGQAKAPSMGQRMGNNLLNGAGSSLDRIADYYIDRAEAIQPVIEINGARKVNIFFTEGAFIGNTTLKKQISKKRDEAIRNIADKESDQFIQKF
jgi:conjugal transfer pilus assembly protein TraB